MSWNVKSVGKAADVVAAIEKEPHVPQGIKDVVKAIGAGPTEYQDGLIVESCGHIGSDGGGNATLKVEQFSIAKGPSPVKEVDGSDVEKTTIAGAA